MSQGRRIVKTFDRKAISRLYRKGFGLFAPFPARSLTPAYPLIGGDTLIGPSLGVTVKTMTISRHGSQTNVLAEFMVIGLEHCGQVMPSGTSQVSYRSLLS